MRAFLIAILDLILARPWLTLAVVALMSVGLARFVPQFELDASADSLLLEGDTDIRYYRSVIARYGADNYLVITYTAWRDLFDDATLADLTQMRDELLALENVDKVISMLDVPLIDSPRVTLTELAKHVPTLEDPQTDRRLAKIELRESPIYSNLLMSLDGDTTALLVLFHQDEEYTALLTERDRLREKMLTTKLSADENDAVALLSLHIKELRVSLMAREQDDVAAVREIMSRHTKYGDLHLGGLPMIVSDMIDYIRSDIAVFGTGILLFLVLLLSVIFGRIHWVCISLLCCVAAVLFMVGLLGLLKWRVTVVSSNFVALLLIFSLSLTVHLIQRYRELHHNRPDAEQVWLLRQTLMDKAGPCFFTALTTMVGFASLLVSGIRPVIDFGWMMVMGMVAVLLTAFLLFPSVLVLLYPGLPTDRGDSTRIITGFFATLVEKRPTVTMVICAALALASIGGMARLEVENRFIDYFKEKTEIHQGMLTIDRELGGTVPLDIILDADSEFLEQQAAAGSAADSDDEFADFGDEFEDDFDADFDDDFGNEFDVEDSGTSDLGATSYWYNTFRLKRLREVHDYLDNLPETGKVLSMATTIETLAILNNDETPGTFFLSVLYNRLPANIKEALFDPYMSSDGNQVRISIRIIESDKNLRRDALLKEIRTHLVDEMGFQPERVHVTGMLVLYNNVLQSLYRSQILTMGVVFVSIMLMFGVLFRSARIAFVAILPSMLSVGVVLGVMGWLGIPLDIMTITIAAISVGIGVDDSIHYIHRYRQEIAVDDKPLQAVQRSHASVGRAMFYTSVIIIAGFSILALSNFIPSILFGLLTGLAMFMALVTNLTLLPVLLIWAKIR
jgi:predicted RND superfamily exporter protein